MGAATVTTHGFQAGADWREGDWHEVNAERAQWLSAVDGSGARPLFLVMERNDYASSTMAYDGALAAARVDLSRDVIYLGPFEEQIHVENPGPGPARSRVVVPPLELESVFTGVAIDADDEPWQHYAYLSRYRSLDYRNTVTFNSDSVDGNRISTGAKDDMDFAEVQRQAASLVSSASRRSSSTTAGRPAPATGARTRPSARNRATRSTRTGSPTPRSPRSARPSGPTWSSGSG